MKFLILIGRTIVSVIAIVFFHLLISYRVPDPFGYINVVFVLLSLFLLLTESGSVVWVSFLCHLFIELFATTPFGLILFSGTVSMLIVYWLYQHFFTNKSWYTATVISFLAISIYRMLHTFFLLVSFSFLDRQSPSWRFLFIVYGWEVLLTSIFTGILYLLVTREFRVRKAVLPSGWGV